MQIPALTKNLIFVSKLDDAGVKIVFEKDTCKMVRGALVLMRGVRIGTLYNLQGSTVIDGCNSSVVPKSGAENLVVYGEKTVLWHQRLGHIGEKGLRILHGKGMIEGMSNSSLDFDFCENCVYGKKIRVSFPFGGKKAKQMLELVHSDVFGPVKVSSLAKWSCRKNEQDVDENGKKHAQWCRVRTGILGRGGGEHVTWSTNHLHQHWRIRLHKRTVKEAVDSEDGKLWKEAMVDEMASLHKNEAWDLVELLAGREHIGSKWVFKKKTNAEGKVEKYKARLVAKGYSQVTRIDFGDIFSLVAKVTSIRLLLSVAAAFDIEVEQMDVKTTFLHGDLEEEIYMKQP
eukprot:PITA_20988